MSFFEGSSISTQVMTDPFMILRISIVYQIITIQRSVLSTERLDIDKTYIVCCCIIVNRIDNKENSDDHRFMGCLRQWKR